MSTLSEVYEGLIKTIYDTEVFPNLTRFGMLDEATNSRLKMSVGPKGWNVEQQVKMQKFLKERCLHGWNNQGYDDWILLGALNGANCFELKALSDMMIDSRENFKSSVYVVWYNNWQQLKGEKNTTNFALVRKEMASKIASIDLLQIFNMAPNYGKQQANGEKAVTGTFNQGCNLKKAGCRIGFKSVMDSPLPFDQPLTKKTLPIADLYLDNDVDTTLGTYLLAKPLFGMRLRLFHEYAVDCLAKKDATLTREILAKIYCEKSGDALETIKSCAQLHKNKTHVLELPRSIKVAANKASPAVKKVIDHYDYMSIRVNSDGYVEGLEYPETFVAGIGLAFGRGGIHSIDNALFVEEDEKHVYWDIDVVSMYPNAMLTNAFAPSHLSKPALYLNAFRGLLEGRIKAKKAGDTILSNALKICVNSAFGDLGQPFSPFFDPLSAISITVFGQLSILLLIDQLGEVCQCISANTDGVLLRIPKGNEAKVESVYKAWGNHFGFEMERKIVKKYVRDSVNSYLAILEGGELKSKGLLGFAEGENVLKRDSGNAVILKALYAYLKDGTPPQEAVRQITNMADYCDYVQANKPFEIYADEKSVGRVIRLYCVTANPQTITKRTPDKTITLFQGMNVRSAMVLPDIVPPDLDYDWYVNETQKMIDRLKLCTYNEKRVELSRELFAREVYIVPKIPTLQGDWEDAIKGPNADFAGCAIGTAFGKNYAQIAVEDGVDVLKISNFVKDTGVIWTCSLGEYRIWRIIEDDLFDEIKKLVTKILKKEGKKAIMSKAHLLVCGDSSVRFVNS